MRVVRTIIAIMAALLLTNARFVSTAASTAPPVQVWFTPASDSRDFIDMFRNPQLWNKARSQISVFKLGPRQLGGNNVTGINTISDLSRANAFQLLTSWGISLALEAPAIKEWDCTGRRTVEATSRLIGNARAANGFVKFVSMDEPLRSGLDFCRDSLEAVANKTAAYITELKSRDPTLEVGDIEPYPWYLPLRLEQWLTRLTADGAKPAHFHLDVDVHYLDTHPNIDLAADLQNLKAFLRKQGIPFGVIFWSAHGPEPTDQEYFNHTMAWANRVRLAIGAPDHAIFQSWITRSYPGCNYSESGCASPKIRCPTADTSGCGLHSVPVNLPENDSEIFSHTRLLNNALEILRK